MTKRCLFALLFAVASATTAFSAVAAVPMVPVPGTPAAPAFTLPGADGARHSLKEYRGRLVLVNFWAGWCAPCRREMPALQRLYERLEGEGLTVVAVHAGPVDERGLDVVRVNGLEFPLLVDETLALGAWQVNRLPTSVLLDPQGRMIYRMAEPRDWDSPGMVEFLRRHLPAARP